MQHKLISGDNHIDLTYCPPDLWSSQAPAKWKLLAPRVEERNDGQHWFVDDKDRGMWNGVGPGFLPVHQGLVRPYRRDEGRGLRVGQLSRRQAAADHARAAHRRPRPRRARRKEIIYGCLMINDLIDDAELRVWANALYNDWAADFAKRVRPQPRLPARHHPQHRSRARRRPRCGAAPRWG